MAWLLTPRDLAAIAADGDLRARLARGERPGPDDLDPVARLLGRWLLEVANSNTTDAAVTS